MFVAKFIAFDGYTYIYIYIDGAPLITICIVIINYYLCTRNHVVYTWHRQKNYDAILSHNNSSACNMELGDARFV